MRLLDDVFQAHDQIIIETPRGERRLPGAGAIAAELARCPLRFVCDRAVTEAAAIVALDFRLLSGCFDLIRFPASSVWVEWDEDVRRSFFCSHGVGAASATQGPTGQRVGLLARIDEDARKLAVQVCWSRPAQGRVELSPVSIEMDISERGVSATSNGVHLSIDDDQADAVLARMSFVVRPEWRDYYAEFSASPLQAVESARTVALDANMLMALALLLAAREPLRHTMVDRSQLNLSRRRRGRPALLDHVELAMPLAVAEFESEARREAQRAASRLHMVRAHLVRRGTGIFWRRAHLRGHAERGQITTRTIALRGT